MDFDKSIIRQYNSLINEIEAEGKRIDDLEKEIKLLNPKRREVSDIVTKGKRGKKPLGTYKIQGFEDYQELNRKTSLLKKRKAQKELHIAELEMMVINVEAYIYNLNDSEIRNILLYYCIDRKSWKEVAELMGEGYTAEACKKNYSRFLRVK